MEFNIITTLDELDTLSVEWNALLENSASRVPFLRYEYLRAWWETRGGGEWPFTQSQLNVITAKQDGNIIGIAPFFSSPNLQNEPSLLFIGSIEVSDFLDFIITPQDLPRFIPALLNFLNEQDDPKWQMLDLYNILDNSPTLAIIKTSAEANGWLYTQKKLQPSPYITLPGDWEAYLAGIDKKQRHEIRRKLRRTAEAPIQADWYIVEKGQRLATETESFIDMMAGDPEKQIFLTDLMRQHLHNTARVAFENDWLQLSFFTLGGEKAAAYMSFIYDQRLWVYNSGWNLKYSEFSPGWVLLANLLKWSNDNGIHEFDFMRGGERYKYKFGGVDRYVVRAVLRPA